MSHQPLLTIHTDGASRGNPGAAAFAYTIERDGHEAIERAGCLGKMTNNEAEYTALVRALEHALRLGPAHRLVVHSDSELMVKQMKGEYRVKKEELRDLYEQARDLVKQFSGSVTFRHVRRELNKRADELCNQELDGVREQSAEELMESLAPRAAAPPALAQPNSPPAQKKPAPLRTLKQEALTVLEEAEAQPSAEEVWQQLVTLLAKHGIRTPGS